MTDKQDKHVAIIDHVGRNIIGKLVSETDKKMVLNNPVILHVQPDQGGKLEVQSFPLFFFEFIDKEHRDDNNWSFNKDNIVFGEVILDEKIINQYDKINVPVQQDSNNEKKPNVVSIDDV